jgi:hypothetical protein
LRALRAGKVLSGGSFLTLYTYRKFLRHRYPQ